MDQQYSASWNGFTIHHPPRCPVLLPFRRPPCPSSTGGRQLLHCLSLWFRLLQNVVSLGRYTRQPLWTSFLHLATWFPGLVSTFPSFAKSCLLMGTPHAVRAPACRRTPWVTVNRGAVNVHAQGFVLSYPSVPRSVTAGSRGRAVFSL